MNVNAGRLRTSGRIQPAPRKFRVTIGVLSHLPNRGSGAEDRRQANKENTMLRKFAGVLLATALLAGPAFAAQSTDNAGSTAA